MFKLGFVCLTYSHSLPNSIYVIKEKSLLNNNEKKYKEELLVLLRTKIYLATEKHEYSTIEQAK